MVFPWAEEPANFLAALALAPDFFSKRFRAFFFKRLWLQGAKSMWPLGVIATDKNGHLNRKKSFKFYRHSLRELTNFDNARLNDALQWYSNILEQSVQLLYAIEKS